VAVSHTFYSRCIHRSDSIGRKKNREGDCGVLFSRLTLQRLRNQTMTFSLSNTYIRRDQLEFSGRRAKEEKNLTRILQISISIHFLCSGSERNWMIRRRVGCVYWGRNIIVEMTFSNHQPPPMMMKKQQKANFLLSG